LVRERENSRFVRRDEGSVDGSSPVRIIIGKNQRIVIDSCVHIDPVRTANGCLSLYKIGVARQSRMDGLTGYVGFPRGFPGVGKVPLVTNPVCVYESPLVWQRQLSR
jgi:hypothetical protein